MLESFRPYLLALTLGAKTLIPEAQAADAWDSVIDQAEIQISAALRARLGQSMSRACANPLFFVDLYVYRFG